MYRGVQVGQPLTGCVHSVHSLEQPLQLLNSHGPRQLLTELFGLRLIGTGHTHSWVKQDKELTMSRIFSCSSLLQSNVEFHTGGGGQSIISFPPE